MRPKTADLLALVVVLLGSAHLASPAAVFAESAAEPACCHSSTESCCGSKCSIDAEGSCDSCSGFWGCLFN
jgi:hypothetical protein